VRKWLINLGQVDSGRLSARGYGYGRADRGQRHPEGRQQNRRVQFKIIDKRNRDKSEVSP
jgi:outer membrane protein OmpA-like peptidoglycan-associated protein